MYHTVSQGVIVFLIRGSCVRIAPGASTFSMTYVALLTVQEGLTDPAQITAATMATSGKAIFFNAVVVIGGFLIFLTSNFSSLFYLGAMLSLSMGACLIVSMTVLPAILNRFKPRFVYGPERNIACKVP